MPVSSATPAWRQKARLWIGFVACVGASNAMAATCTWSAAAPASWHEPANWSACAGGNGSPAGTPGPADSAVIPAGVAWLDGQLTTVANLQLAPGAELGVVETWTTTRQLTITGSFTMTNATVSGALPPPGGPSPAYLSLQLPVGSTVSLGGANLFRRAILTNAGSATLNGGSGARLDFDLSGQLVNSAEGQVTVNGDYIFGYTISGDIRNEGTWINQGPGLMQIQRSGANGGKFTSTGLFEIHNATFKVLNPLAGFQASFNTSLRLRDGTFDGGISELVIPAGGFFEGSGSVIGPFRSSGLLDPEAANGDPFGVLSVQGDAQFNQGEIALDLSGPGATQHDRISVSGSIKWQRVSPRVRFQGGYAPGIDSSITIATHASRISPTTPVHERVLSDYPLSLALRPTPTQTDLRVVPTLTLARTQVSEGNSGTQQMQVAVSLSAPTSQTVSFGYTTSPGTAVTIAAGGNAADFDNALGTVTFNPGETSKQIPITINGDSSVEADEAFSIVTDDSSTSSTLQNASFGNNRRFTFSAEGRIVDDDGPPGRRYLLIGKTTNQPTPTGQVSKISRYTTDGEFVDGWDNKLPNTLSPIGVPMCRTSSGEVLTGRFSYGPGPVLMSATGTVLDETFGGFMGSEESCAFDALGNVWVGEEVPPEAESALLRYVAPDGRVLRSLAVPVGLSGTDDIELDADQCTIYYNSEDTEVRRFDVCLEQPMTPLATALPSPCFALRQLPNGELMVTCRDSIYRFDPSGVLVHEYSRISLGENDSNGLYAMSIDPDGETFWTGGITSGRVVRARLDDGSVVTSFTTGSGGTQGLMVQDEFASAIGDEIFADDFEP